jgi:hypothetical protein
MKAAGGGAAPISAFVPAVLGIDWAEAAVANRKKMIEAAGRMVLSTVARLIQAWQ